jgi:DNA-directed RNA polymerase specialized sigma subunit
MAKNPLEDFLAEKEKTAETRRINEIKMWETWQQAPQHQKPDHLAPLLKAYEPVFNRKINEWSRGAKAIQPTAFKAELQRHFIGALETYDPNKAALSTHVETRLQKAKRYVVKHQNLAYIPEGQVAHIGRIRKAQDELQEEFGRVPSHDEIADHLGMSPKRVNTILSAVKKDIPASRFESDPTTSAIHREREVLDLLQYNLSPDEKQVFDLLYGRNGNAPVTSTNDLAKRLGKSAPQVSRLKTSILNKYKNYT